MKKIILVVLIGFLAFTLRGQSTIVLDENFKDNSNSWLTSTKGDFSAEVKDGAYILSTHTNTSKVVYHEIESFKAEDNFVIEADFKQLDKKRNKYFGLVFSADKTGKNEILFTITSSGYNSIIQNINDEDSVIYDLDINPNINGLNNINTFRVEKISNSIFYYLNNELVHVGESDKYYYPYLGLYLDGKIEVEVSKVKVSKSERHINIVQGADTVSDKVKLGKQINSEYDELLPVITADGKTLYVIRNNHPENYGPADNDQDIWVSKLDENGEWGELENIGKPLNNKDYNFVVSASPDNNSLVVGNIYGPGGKTIGQGLSITYKTEDGKGWQVPQTVDIKNYYNDHEFVSFFLCNDNKTLIMSLERDDSMGERDFYVSFLNDDDSWTEPLHMGNVINTIRDEGNPFVAADNKTMYFASTGHSGYGKHDIFVTKRIGESWTDWSEPKNLGPKINTDENDLNYFLDAKGETAYLASKGGIYIIDNVEKIGPATLVSGVAYNRKTNQPIGTMIRYYDLSTNKELGRATSDPVTGEYKIVLPTDRRYSFVADQDGFFPISENLDLRGMGEYSEYERDLFLLPLEKGRVVRLNNVFFDFDRANLLPESYNELDRLYNLLKEYPSLEIQISGHTDDVGNEVYNQKLSEQRAKSVVNYLLSKKISSNRLKAVGYGKTEPVVPNDSEENRAYNRRVEFKILRR